MWHGASSAWYPWIHHNVSESLSASILTFLEPQHNLFSYYFKTHHIAPFSGNPPTFLISLIKTNKNQKNLNSPQMGTWSSTHNLMSHFSPHWPHRSHTSLLQLCTHPGPLHERAPSLRLEGFFSRYAPASLTLLLGFCPNDSFSEQTFLDYSV